MLQGQALHRRAHRTDALDIVAAKTAPTGWATLKRAVDNVRPSSRCAAVRVGATYQVPVEVKASSGPTPRHPLARGLIQSAAPRRPRPSA